MSEELDDVGFEGPRYDLIWGTGRVAPMMYLNEPLRLSVERSGIEQFMALQPPTDMPRVGPILDFWAHDIATHTYVHRIEQLVCQSTTEGE
jgi:hypothetical protein